METFDWLKFSKTIFWVVVAGSVGIATQIEQVAGDDGLQLSDIDWTSAGLLTFGWGVARSAVGWWNASRPPWAVGRKVLGFALVCGLAASMSACGTLRPALGDHSATVVSFNEKTAAGDHTRINIKATGEAAQTAGVNYTGQTMSEGETPWSLSVHGDQTVTSPQAQVLAQGIASAIEQTPATIGGLAHQIATLATLPGITATSADGGMGASIIRPIIQHLIEQFLMRGAAP